MLFSEVERKKLVDVLGKDLAACHPYFFWADTFTASPAITLLDRLIARFSADTVFQTILSKKKQEILNLGSFYGFFTEMKIADYLSQAYDGNFQFGSSKKHKAPDFMAGGLHIEAYTPLKSLPMVNMLNCALGRQLQASGDKRKIFVDSVPFTARAKIPKLTDVRVHYEKVLKVLESTAYDFVGQIYEAPESRLSVRIAADTGQSIIGTGFSSVVSFIAECIRHKDGQNGLRDLHPNLIWVECAFNEDYQIEISLMPETLLQQIKLPWYLDALFLTICGIDEEYQTAFQAKGNAYSRRMLIFYNKKSTWKQTLKDQFAEHLSYPIEFEVEHQF